MTDIKTLIARMRDHAEACGPTKEMFSFEDIEPLIDAVETLTTPDMFWPSRKEFAVDDPKDFIIEEGLLGKVVNFHCAHKLPGFSMAVLAARDDEGDDYLVVRGDAAKVQRTIDGILASRAAPEKAGRSA